MRILLKRLLVAVVIPACLVIVLEVVLRGIGFGVPSRLYLVNEWSGQLLATENPHFTRKYFGPRLERAPWQVAFPAPKPANEFRVFLLGESAALGDPIPEYGMARMLEVLLQETMTNRRVRVINSAITAINSHVIRDIAREIVRYEPDAVVIYMGNNEVVGPFGPGTVFPAVAGSPRMIRCISFVRGTRIGQAVEALAWFIRPPPFQKWEGMEMFLDRQVAPDDPRLTTTYRIFENNLNFICSLLEQNDIPVVLSTVAVNLRDCAPLASPLPDNAANHFFLKARELDAKGQYEEAAISYRAAMEADTLRFRADSAINDAVRRVAARNSGRKLTLVDSERIIENASPGRIPGEAFFYDHVHLNFSGQYLLARNLAATFAQPLTGTGDALAEKDVARHLGWTTWSEKDTLGEMYARRMRPPFSGQLDRAEVEERWAGQLIDLEIACRDQCLNAACETIEQAIEKRGDHDPDLWKLLADVEINRLHSEKVALAYGRAAELLPHQAARLVMAQAAAVAAIDADKGYSLIKDDVRFRRWPEDRIWSDMGSVLVEWGWLKPAEPLLHKAWLLNSENPDALVNLGVGRAVSGNPGDAVTMLRKAVAVKPEDEVAWANLGRALYESGEKVEGIQSMERAVVLNPQNGLTRSSLAVMYFREKNYPKAREHFDAAMIESPLDAVLLADAAQLAVIENQYERAGELQARAARLSPSDALSHYLAGQILLQTSRKPEAVEYLRKALLLSSGQIDWRRNLIWILAAHPDERLRNPDEALGLADELPDDTKNAWMNADLKAAALAAGGRTDEAAELLSRVDMQSVPAEIRGDILDRLEHYRQGMAYVADEEEFRPITGVQPITDQH